MIDEAERDLRIAALQHEVACRISEALGLPLSLVVQELNREEEE